MSTYDDYLTHDDKPYAENINDALLLSNVFDLTVPIELPLMFKNGQFNTSISPRKAGVALITYVEKTFDVEINNDNIRGVGDLTFKFYPNFNSYGTLTTLDWTVTEGTVTADIIGADNTTLLSGHTGGVISGAGTGINELQEFKIVLHLDGNNGATITKLNFIMANKDEDRYGAEVGISDVTNLQTILDGKSNTGHTHTSSEVTNLIDTIYPVGSIYLSVTSTSPATLFGGTWTRLKDRFLLGAGDTYTNESTGGSATVALTESEMPRHTHIQNSHNHTSLSSRVNYGSGSDRQVASGTGVYYQQDQATNNATATNKYTGGSGSSQSASNGVAHENMPPYRVVYMWTRTA